MRLRKDETAFTIDNFSKYIREIQPLLQAGWSFYKMEGEAPSVEGDRGTVIITLRKRFFFTFREMIVTIHAS